MPLYEYDCEACGKRFEVIRKFSDPPLEVCTSCGKGPIVRRQSSPAIQFKGTGWYITDYAKKGTSESSRDKGGGDKSDAGKADKTDAAGKSDTAGKSDVKSEGKSDSAPKTDGKSDGKSDSAGKSSSSSSSTLSGKNTKD